MQELKRIPAVLSGDIRLGECGLEIHPLGQTQAVETAWSWLPEGGQGVVVLADRIQRYRSGDHSPLLLEAEVVMNTATTVIRQSGIGWAGWRWVEQITGNTHRYVEHVFRSSEPNATEGQNLIYRQYWQLQSTGADDVPVWTPIGSRFCGFQGG